MTNEERARAAFQRKPEADPEPLKIETDDWREALIVLVTQARGAYQSGDGEEIADLFGRLLALFNIAHERGWEFSGLGTLAYFAKDSGADLDHVAAAVYGMAEAGQITREDFERILLPEEGGARAT